MPRSGESARITKTIAIVEPDASVRSSLEFALVAEGLSVAIYNGGQDLIDAVDFRPAACVIIEQKLPDTTGMEVVDRLRGRRITTPVILLVTDPDRTLHQQAQRAGVTIVEKPLIGNMLTDKLHEIID